MIKYLAIIQDSFREAFASRILWMLLILITILLGLLAPFGFREVDTAKITDNDYRDPWEFLAYIRTAGSEDKPSPAHRVWSLMDEKYRTRLANAKLPSIDREQGNPIEAIRLFGDFSRQMNKLIERPDLYDAASWKDVPILASQAKSLLKKHEDKELTPAELPRFNRLMLEAGLSGMLRESLPTSVQWRYAWMDFGSPDPLSGNDIREFIQGNAAWVMKWVVGVAGVLVAILVTSPIIPQMFDQGSLHLLLSKPVSRWMLLLAKFVGGCAFILLTSTYLIVGLWVIVGVRFGVWETRLLLSIPVYLFVFTIYYSLSTLTGVIWRSAIVSVAICVIFYLVCWALGGILWGVERGYVQKDRFVHVIEAKDTFIATNEMGWCFQWDETESRWRQAFTSNEQRNMGIMMRVAPVVPREFRSVGPVYDKTQDRLVAAVPAGFPPRSQNLAVGTRKSKWDSLSKTSAPMGTMKILVEPTGRILFVSSLGLYRLTGDPLEERKPVKLFGMNLPVPGGGPLQPVTPDPAVLATAPADAAINKQTGELAVYTRSTITILVPSKNRYGHRVERKLDGPERQAAVIGFAGKSVVVGRPDGHVEVLDAATLQTVKKFEPEPGTAPRFIDSSPDGRWFSVLFHNGRLHLYDSKAQTMAAASVSGQGDISACNFSDQGSLLVVDRGNRLSKYSHDTFKFELRRAPSIDFLLGLYRYGIKPLYTVFPKPRELDTTYDYLLSGKKTKSSNPGQDLVENRDTVDPWSPVWSSAGFTVIILLLACVYIQFQEF